MARTHRGGSLTEEFREQLEDVERLIEGDGIWSTEHVRAMVHEYYNIIGLPRQYFMHTSAERIAKHIQSLDAAKVLAKNAGDPLDLSLSHEEEDSALFVARSTVVALRDGRVARSDEKFEGVEGAEERDASGKAQEGVTGKAKDPSPCARVEAYLEERYLSAGAQPIIGDHVGGDISQLQDTLPATSLSRPSAQPRRNRIFRLQCFRSSGVASAMRDRDSSPIMGPPLRLYFLEAPSFTNPSPAPGETRLEELADVRFLQQTASLPRLRGVFQRVMEETTQKLGPSIHAEIIGENELEAEFEEENARPAGAPSPMVTKTDEVGEKMVLLVVGVNAGSTHSLFQGITDVYRWHGLYATRKYCEPFANGVIIFSFYLKSLDAVGPSTQVATAEDGEEPARGGDEAHKHANSTTELLQAAALRGARTRQARARLSLEHRLVQLLRDVSLCFVLPKTSITQQLSRGILSAQEVAYAYVAWKFAYTFLSRGSEEFAALAHRLRDDPNALAMLSRMRRSLRTHAFTEGTILSAIYRRPDMVSRLYSDFAARFMPGLSRRYDCVTPHAPGAGTAGSGRVPSVVNAGPEMDEPLQTLHPSDVRRACQDETDTQIFLAFLSFNKHVLKTNFYKQHSVALSFRLDPLFLSKDEYPDTPFAVFFVLGAEFRGFHIRFADIARGGIRIIKSSNTQSFAHNVESMFDEGYGLANTQQKKNKDIPEGGSKGVILLNLGHQDKERVAFQKYCDAILDLILVPVPPVGQHPQELPIEGEEIVDYYGHQELLFFGPDENTAGFMDWASQWARHRGYPYWKAFTTGKSWQRGGLPHDVFGMTTQSVRGFVEGIQRELGLDAASCTKIQTGGPDGDLGSNEIKYGSERTLGIVDGSGVLYDPEGIDKEELLRLAHARKPVKFFNLERLSAQGFFVGIDDRDVRLPNGIVVESGLDFRNRFHLQPFARADFFVPCGGRPAAVTLENVEDFLYGARTEAAEEGESRGAPRFKYVVEGANLFFTQDARVRMEKEGLVVVKDASANKGGVTCSSLEVLAALSLNDEEFNRHMTVATRRDDGGEPEPPEFYQRYARQIQREIIPGNARLEFDCLWREHLRTKRPLCQLTDEVSVKITDLSSRVEESNALWNNEALRRRVLRSALPSTLAEVVGGADTVLERLPENYLRALFGSRLASRYIYEMGINAPEFAFFEYVDKLLHSE